jgi:hypothetical protein
VAASWWKGAAGAAAFVAAWSRRVGAALAGRVATLGCEQLGAEMLGYCDEKVANREIGVRHFVIGNGY